MFETHHRWGGDTQEQERSSMNMKRNQERAEVTIQIDYRSKTANLCVAEWPAMARRLQKLYGQPKKVSRTADTRSITTAFWQVPFKAVSFRNLKKRQKQLSTAA
jgi:hypothetical protein